MKKYILKLEGLDCVNCANMLENEISKIELVRDVNINFMSGKLMFNCEIDNYEDVIKQIKKIIKDNEPDVIVEE